MISVQLLRTRETAPRLSGAVEPPVVPEAAAHTVPSVPRPWAPHVLVLVAGLALWALGTAQAQGEEPSRFGLLGVLGVWWYLGLAVLAGGFVAAVTARHRVPNWVLVAHVGALIAVLHGTVPILFEEPRFAWALKHIGPAELLGATGGVDRSLDIYNNWPGFFALASWTSEASGVALLDLARWSQPFFAGLFAAAAAFAARAVLRDERLVLTAAWVFVAANWVGQDIFAPQAPAYVMSLVLLGVVLRSRAIAGDRVTAVLDGRAALVAVAVLWAAVVVTHQLSPILVLASLAVIALVTRGIPLWVPLALGVVELLWLVQAWSWLDANVDLFSPELAASARPDGFSEEGVLPGYELATLARLAVSGAVVAAAVAGVWLRRRATGRWEPALYAVVLVPALIVVVQRYGGEGPLRAFLFALPFLAALAVAWCAPAGAVHRRRLGALAAVLALAAPAAVFGLELGNRVPPEDLRVALWLERNAPANAARVYPSAVAAREVSAGYARLVDGPRLLLSEKPEYLGEPWGPRTAEMVDRDLRELGAPASYVVLTPGQERYLALYGIADELDPRQLGWSLLATGRYAIAHRDGDAVVLRRVAPSR